MSVARLYPIPEKDGLNHLIGTSLQNAPVPSAVLDVAKVKHNCELMLQSVKALGIGLRAHVKTHKTTELTRLQIGEDALDVRLIASTLAELEHLVPLIDEYRAKGATVHVLYGIPPGRSHKDRLTEVFKSAGTLALMVDNPEQLTLASEIFSTAAKGPIDVFLKTDSGYHRAGLSPTSARMQALVEATLLREKSGEIQLMGFYSHNSLSYGGNSPLEAMDNLTVEVGACLQAAAENTPAGYIQSRTQPLCISCGAGPTAMSLQNLLSQDQDVALTEAAQRLRTALSRASQAGMQFEIHSGIFPTLDLQQTAASSRDLGLQPERNIAITVLTEVCATYPDRTEHPEALINAGCLALGREPCKSYRGHGVLSAFNMGASYMAFDKAHRIIVDRVSQEHGLLQWENVDSKDELPLQYGQRLRLWPNHACITGAQYAAYLIVDSESDDPDLIRDVWTRWRGW